MDVTAFRSPEAAENLLVSLENADAYCRREMAELHAAARAAVAGIRVVEAAQSRGYGFDPSACALLYAFQARVAFCRRYFVIFAVRGAVLSGRWPEADERDAWARCEDDDGLMAFLDDMQLVPVGFVDTPNNPPRPN